MPKTKYIAKESNNGALEKNNPKKIIRLVSINKNFRKFLKTKEIIKKVIKPK